jgi:hypothetical protein
MKQEKFIIKRFKKDGTEMAPVKIKSGVWVEPHIEKQEGIIYYPGTLIPSINYIEAKKYDPHGYLRGGPMPWTDPSTIKINKELLAVENLYEKLEQAKKENNTTQIEFLSSPLISWRCPASENKKNLYAQAMITINRNNKSDFVYENLNRFEVSQNN